MLGDLLAVIAVMVVAELSAARAFAGAARSQWIANTAGALIVAGLVVTVSDAMAGMEDA